MTPPPDQPADHPVVARIKAGEVPDAAKLSAARGLLPIPIEDLLGLLLFLLTDEAEKVKNAARQTLAEYPEEQLLPLISSEGVNPAILDFYANARRSDTVTQAILLNPGTPDDSIEALAGHLSAHLLDILIRNEVRLIRHPAILERIVNNPNASPAVKKRSEEITRDFIQTAPAVMAPPTDEAEQEAAEPEEEEAAEAKLPSTDASEEEDEEQSSALRALIKETADDEDGSDEDEEEEEEEEDEEEEKVEKKYTLEQKIMKLKVSDKLKLAYLGGRQSRMILIKDPNRTVSMAVLGGGKISQAEIELVTQLKNIDLEVFRKISTMKQFMKVYQIALNLIKNPRTPLGIAMPLMNRLQNVDLKRIENNTSVSGMIRTNAKRILRAAASGQKS